MKEKQLYWELLYDIYYKKVLNICRAIIIDSELAKDATSDTFLKIYRKIHTLKDPEKRDSWVFTIARNTAKDYVKTKLKTPTMIDLDNYKEIESEISIEENYQTKESVEELFYYFKKLDTKYKEVLIMFALENKTHKEIAKELKITESAAKVRLHRAKELVKDFIHKREECKRSTNGSVRCDK